MISVALKGEAIESPDNTQATLSMIMVMDRNKLIGNAGTLPWHISSELQYFKSVTMGKPMIMGRKTWESIARALPGRTSIVVTRDPEFKAAAAVVAISLDAAIEIAHQHLQNQSEIMIIGGASLCAAAMPKTQKLYLTVIDAEFSGDTWLHSFNEEDWHEESCEMKTSGGYKLAYRVLTR